mmetsp:Transcript_12105/g.18207  ORF Transcript_12105/g.18207 Transcript_12105/m.18207 type:complete len:477 (+) Transcript_12105:225-1655(+)|eukprot:CAMPEP_0196815212 /NCGR_PEP_ID=MMETSP1362-20130617/48406_1 /TAXON_ID=163516 /ORGANISM="Leptocylindrus danicus, Strain CCMP1856" /LENGTH=476 /DNA_ID=CAMNT_0042192079 /DNA_START=199 /DNA_END=1629 /DNA_ORIENTATION=+
MSTITSPGDASKVAAARGKANTDSESSSSAAEEDRWRDQLHQLKQQLEGEKWSLRFHELQSYKAKYGHCNVPAGSSKLGKWIATQRQHYWLNRDVENSDIMSDERVLKLESIGFHQDWVPDGLTRKQYLWDYMFEELQSYKVEHGHCNVHVNQNSGGELGTWVATQRQQYRLLKEGKTSCMTDERVRRLESLGFQWSIWDSMFQELQWYKATHGHCNVKMRSGGKLAYWVKAQRQQYRLLRKGKRSPHMPSEREQKLESIGFQWCPRSETKINLSWDEMFVELQLYKAKYGHCNVPKTSGKLGTWVNNQRQQHKYQLSRAGKKVRTLTAERKARSLTDERVQKLESIGFKWRASQANVPSSQRQKQQDKGWNARFQELQSFETKYGHCDVPMNFGTLGIWVDIQRQKYRQTKEGTSSYMTQERAQKLELIGFQWSVSTTNDVSSSGDKVDGTIPSKENDERKGTVFRPFLLGTGYC